MNYTLRRGKGKKEEKEGKEKGWHYLLLLHLLPPPLPLLLSLLPSAFTPTLLTHARKRGREEGKRI
jgi:hypothetical protein